MSDEKLDEFGYAVQPEEDDEDQAPVNEGSGVPTLPELPELKWTARRSGEDYPCRVAFRDPTELTGNDLDNLRRSAGGGGKNRGEVGNRLAGAALSLLISEWEIGYLPNLGLPRDAKSPVGVLNMLSAFDKAALERHVTPVINQLLRGRVAGDGSEGSGPGSPATPGRG